MFDRMKRAEAAYDRYGTDEALREFERAELDYWAAVREAMGAWDALPHGERKAAAEDRAHSIEGTDDDKLRWYEIAVASFHLLTPGNETS